jgi:hypothetical protein
MFMRVNSKCAHQVRPPLARKAVLDRSPPRSTESLTKPGGVWHRTPFALIGNGLCLARRQFVVVAFATQSQAVPPSAERDYPTCLVLSNLSINPFMPASGRRATKGERCLSAYRPSRISIF